MIRKSYKGGFTYLNPRYKEKDIGSGVVFDVNSLYPSVMHDKPLPYGEGIYFTGEYKPDKLYNLYVQSFTCQFELKPDYIPTIQLKNNLAFIPTEYITSSENKEITMTLTSVDLELFLDHYDVYNIEYHDGWKFKSSKKLFTEYIDKWTAVKIQSKIEGNKAMYLLAKLMLNALYGKFATNPNVRSKIPYYDNGMIKYIQGEKGTKDCIYIPVGTFVTSYAREKTIRSAQAVYDRFIYADTDSLHLEGTDIPEELDVDDTALGKWKHESTFSKARFLRQKSYIEFGHDPSKNEPDEWKITCAGMPEACYKYVTWDNFRVGAVYGGKLQQKHVKGGIILKNIDFSLKEKKLDEKGKK
jgi:hypothetical protein